jgi:hypothetical protein
LLPFPTEIFRLFGLYSKFVESILGRIAARIELAQDYIKIPQVALSPIAPIESYGALPL